MLQLPDLLRVQLQTDDPALNSLGGIMICADFYRDGNYYWGTLLGLSQADGSLEIRRASLLADFREDQQFGLMDYKSPLEQSDARMTVRIPGGDDFRSAQISIKGQAHITPSAQHAWKTAVNTSLLPSVQDVSLARAEAELVVVHSVRSGPTGRGF